MRNIAAPSRGTLLGAALIVSFLLIGVVMADPHVPVAIEPNAARPAGVEVATFALG
jgi:hypothetical protein